MTSVELYLKTHILSITCTKKILRQKEKKTTCLFDLKNVNSLCLGHHYINSLS